MEDKECVRQQLPVLLPHTEPEQRTPDYVTCEKELAGEKSKVVASNVDRLLASISLLAKDDCVQDLSSDVPSCRAR